MTATCYCCSNPAVGQGDHVPPKSFFPIGEFSTSKPIIVPACDTHNGKQSRADEHLKYILTSSAEHVPDEVRTRTAKSAVRFAKKPGPALQKHGMTHTGQGIVIGQEAQIDPDLLVEALTKVARGVYFHHHKENKKLVGEVEVHPLFLGVESNAPIAFKRYFHWLLGQTEADLRDFPMLGEHQSVFAYQVNESPNLIMIILLFYQTKVACIIKRVNI